MTMPSTIKAAIDLGDAYTYVLADGGRLVVAQADGRWSFRGDVPAELTITVPATSADLMGGNYWIADYGKK